ncbi:MAG: restriction endonuclease subunit S [Janthinobacterium lividum]
MQENQELPQRWVWSSVGELGNVSGGLTKNAKRTELEVQLPYLRVANVQANRLHLTEIETIGVSESEINRVLLQKGDLLVVEGNGSPDQIGRLAIWDGSISPCLHQNHLIKVRLHPLLQGPYVVNWLLSKEGRDYIREVASSTSGLYTLSISKIAALPVPLAPLPEQRRIVAKLEELFSRLDAGVATLRQTQAQLKRYRQSVLHAAVTGELTRAWREAHPAPTESGAALLQRIRQERRAQWEAAQVAKRGGQLPMGDAWKSKYEEPAAPDTSELPELPKGWVWATLSQLGSWTGGGTPSKSNPDFWSDGTVLWVSPKDMKSWRLNDSEDKITESAVEGSTAKLITTPALLFVVRSGILRRILPVAILEKTGTVNQDIKALSPYLAELADYLLYVAQGLNNDIRASCMKSGTTVESIEVMQLQEYAVPLPPLVEQAQVIAEVERRLSVLDNLERTLSAELTRAERLRQSILHRAFTGRLVPQDATDEPAAALLARLQAAPAAAQARRGRQPKAAQTALEL